MKIVGKDGHAAWTSAMRGQVAGPNGPAPVAPQPFTDVGGNPVDRDGNAKPMAGE